MPVTEAGQVTLISRTAQGGTRHDKPHASSEKGNEFSVLASHCHMEMLNSCGQKFQYFKRNQKPSFQMDSLNFQMWAINLKN